MAYSGPTIVPRAYYWGDLPRMGQSIADAMTAWADVSQQQRAAALLAPRTVTRETGRNLVGPSLGASIAGQGAPESVMDAAARLFGANHQGDATMPGAVPGSLQESAWTALQPPAEPRPVPYTPEQITEAAAARQGGPRREPIERVPVTGRETETTTEVPTLASRLFEPGLSTGDRLALLKYGPTVQKVTSAATTADTETDRTTRLRAGLERYRRSPSLESFQQHVLPYLPEKDITEGYTSTSRVQRENRLDEEARLKREDAARATEIIDAEAAKLEATNPELAAQLRAVSASDPKRAAAIGKSFADAAKAKDLSTTREQGLKIADEISESNPALSSAIRLAVMQGKPAEAIKVLVEQARQEGLGTRQAALLESRRTLQESSQKFRLEVEQYKAQALAGKADRSQAATLARAALTLRGQIVRQIDSENKALGLASIMQDQAQAGQIQARIDGLTRDLAAAEAEYQRLAREAAAAPGTATPGPGVAPSTVEPAGVRSPASQMRRIDEAAGAAAVAAPAAAASPPAASAPAASTAPAGQSAKVAHVRAQLAGVADPDKQRRALLGFERLGTITPDEANQLRRELGL